jgi:transcriptional regulator with XRE-family HTH domain
MYPPKDNAAVTAEEFGRLVSGWREDSEWTQQELADKAHVSREIVNKIENAKNVQARMVFPVLKALGCDIVRRADQRRPDETPTSQAGDLERHDSRIILRKVSGLINKVLGVLEGEDDAGPQAGDPQGETPEVRHAPRKGRRSRNR